MHPAAAEAQVKAKNATTLPDIFYKHFFQKHRKIHHFATRKEKETNKHTGGSRKTRKVLKYFSFRNNGTKNKLRSFKTQFGGTLRRPFTPPDRIGM